MLSSRGPRPRKLIVTRPVYKHTDQAHLSKDEKHKTVPEKLNDVQFMTVNEMMKRGRITPKELDTTFDKFEFSDEQRKMLVYTVVIDSPDGEMLKVLLKHEIVPSEDMLMRSIVWARARVDIDRDAAIKYADVASVLVSHLGFTFNVDILFDVAMRLRHDNLAMDLVMMGMIPDDAVDMTIAAEMYHVTDWITRRDEYLAKLLEDMKCKYIGDVIRERFPFIAKQAQLV